MQIPCDMLFGSHWGAIFLFICSHRCATQYDSCCVGLLYDDLACERTPVIERALELLPHDMKVGRYRRQYRGAHLEYLRLYLPVEEQNYDPFIPYLAPFVEEAKFQLQEEEELLGYHPYDRRIAYCGLTGFGNMEKGHYIMNIGA
eukprot:GHVS01045038.1.p1 GENE.GHVS01045038.1~~GHVS01045038.1.p1  ORF type:complete len:145 (+),score=14.98 GHVS01045038.1:274-708(+)